ncbi:isoaspartyl peptidase/L-asparaginase, partial [Vibrio genomosp. F10 str. 9ZD137]
MFKETLLTLGIALTAYSAQANTQIGDVADSVSPEFTSKVSDKQSVIAHQYMVAAAHPLAVEAGYEVLKKGGSAADALVAVQTVLG